MALVEPFPKSQLLCSGTLMRFAIGFCSFLASSASFWAEAVCTPRPHTASAAAVTMDVFFMCSLLDFAGVPVKADIDNEQLQRWCAYAKRIDPHRFQVVRVSPLGLLVEHFDPTATHGLLER